MLDRPKRKKTANGRRNVALLLTGDGDVTVVGCEMLLKTVAAVDRHPLNSAVGRHPLRSAWWEVVGSSSSRNRFRSPNCPRYCKGPVQIFFCC